MSSSARDEQDWLDLQFDEKGLIPAIVTDAGDGTVLMFAYMNRLALEKTTELGELHLYSRSRQALWKKGETSGEVFAVEALLTDCDQDVIQVKVVAKGHGKACHTGRRSCFYREIKGTALKFIDQTG